MELAGKWLLRNGLIAEITFLSVELSDIYYLGWIACESFDHKINKFKSVSIPSLWNKNGINLGNESFNLKGKISDNEMVISSRSAYHPTVIPSEEETQG